MCCESSKVLLRIEDNKIIIEPILNPFELALKGSKFMKIKFEEFEKESEEFQKELLNHD